MIHKIIILLLLISYTLADANEACLDIGSSSNEWWFVPELTWWETVIGSIIFVSGFFITVPQMVKIVRKRSSKGVSPEFMLLLSLNMICGFTNGTIFNYPYMESCPYVGYDICIPALLSWMHGVLMTVLSFITLTLVVVFFEKKSETRLYIVLGEYIFYLLLFIVAISLVSVSLFVTGNCSPFSQTLARVCGLIMMIIVTIQNIPQIITTCKFKTSGALSLFANVFNASFFIVVILFNALSTGQDITTFIGMICAFVFQVIITLLQIYYDYLLPKLGKKKTEDHITYDKLNDHDEEQSLQTNQIIQESMNEEKSLLDKTVDEDDD